MISGGGRGGGGGDCPLPPKSSPQLSTLSLRACLSARQGEKKTSIVRFCLPIFRTIVMLKIWQMCCLIWKEQTPLSPSTPAGEKTLSFSFFCFLWRPRLLFPALEPLRKSGGARKPPKCDEGKVAGQSELRRFGESRPFQGWLLLTGWLFRLTGGLGRREKS